MLVEIEYVGKRQMIQAAFIDFIKEPLKAHVVDILGNVIRIDCHDKLFKCIYVDGGLECRNPNAKRGRDVTQDVQFAVPKLHGDWV